MKRAGQSDAGQSDAAMSRTSIEVARLKDLGPSEGEEPIAKDDRFLVQGKSACACLHAVGAGAWDDDNARRIVDFFEIVVDVVHRLHERVGHVVDGAIRVHLADSSQNLIGVSGDRAGFGNGLPH